MAALWPIAWATWQVMLAKPRPGCPAELHIGYAWRLAVSDQFTARLHVAMPRVASECTWVGAKGMPYTWMGQVLSCIILATC